MNQAPVWADELRRRYLQGEASQFLLYGNVHDLVPHREKDKEPGFLSVTEYLSRVLLAPSKDVVAVYNVSSGVRFAERKANVPKMEDLFLQKSVDKVLPALEQLLLGADRVAVVLEYAEMIAPMGDPNFFSEADRQSVVALHRWSMSPVIERRDSVVVVVAENLSELNQKLVANPRIAAIEVPMPDVQQRRAVIDQLGQRFDAAWRERLVGSTAGLKIVQIRSIIEEPSEGHEDPAARERFILQLLGSAPNAQDRAKKLAELTRGMGPDAIRELVNPQASQEQPTDDAERDEILRVVFKRKREIIERECFGLIEFIEPQHDFSVVGGIDEVKRELSSIAKNLREGNVARCPMGVLFTGPMGTGKTFVAEAFVKESGLTAIKLKNFRSKWVGATEGNLERILSVVKAIGQVIVIIDEGDRAFGNQEGGDGDGGTGSRVIARIKEFMSDTTNRGRVLFVVMTNRPDKLDIDLKRAGRLDRKVPFFYPTEPEAVEDVLKAQLRKNKLQTEIELPRDRATISAPLLGYSNAEIEAVVLLANDYANGGLVTKELFEKAVRDFLPTRDTDMITFMELLAVFETNNRRMLPNKYAEMSADELQEGLALMRAKVGHRR